MNTVEKIVINGTESARVRGTDCALTRNARRPVRRTVVLTVSAFALLTTAARAVDTYTYNVVAGTWLSGTNWTGGTSGHFPGMIAKTNTAQGTTTDIAIFGSSLTSTGSNTIGINMGTSSSGANGSLSLGVVEIAGSTNSPSGPVTLNDSSTTVAGVLTLNGGTINNVANTILDNESSKLLTITNGSSQSLGVGLTAATSYIQTNGTGGITISSSISGSGANLTYQAGSTGILTLSGSNTFSGTFTESSGTVNLGSTATPTGALGGVSSVSIANGALMQAAITGSTDLIKDTAAVTVNGTLDLTGGTETVGSLAGTSITATLKIGQYGSNTTTSTFTVGDSTNTSFAGVISGNPVTAGTTIFTKQGTGTLTLTNANTYTGNTSITAGTLLAANTSGSATGTGAVSIGTAGTLASGAGATGTVSGLVTTSGTGSKIAPGATATATTGTVGALTLSGGLNIAAGATIPFDLAATSATSDVIKITAGTFTGGTAPLSVTFNFNNQGATDGTVYTLINFSGATASGVDLTDFMATGVAGTFSVTGTEVDFTAAIAAVPEPATCLSGALLVSAAGWSQRRRLGGLAGSIRTRRTA